MYEFATARSQDHGLGAYHGAEIPYIFDTHDNWLPTTPWDIELTDSMTQYWVNFAKSGNPNGPSFASLAQLLSGETGSAQAQRTSRARGLGRQHLRPLRPQMILF